METEHRTPPHRKTRAFIAATGRYFHYGWMICLACFLMIFCTSFISLGFSVIMVGLREHVGLTGTQTSTILTIRSIASFAAMLVADIFFEKTTFRIGIVIALVFEIVGLQLFRIAGTNMVVYGLGGICAGVCYAYGLMMPASVLMKRWFRKDLAFALAVASAGTGACTVVGSPILQALIDGTGLAGMFNIVCAFIALCAFFVFVIVRDRPGEVDLEPYGGLVWDNPETPKRESPEEKPYLGKGWIWLCAVAVVFSSMAGSPSSSHLALLFSTEGIDPVDAAYGMSVFGIALIIGKLLYGKVDGKLGTPTASNVFGIAVLAGLALCSLFGAVPTLATMYASCVTLGFGESVVSLGYPLWAADFSPRGGYVKNLKIFQLGYQAGAMVGSPIPGIFADHLGSYTGSYTLFGLFYCMTIIIVSLAYKAYARKVAEHRDDDAAKEQGAS